MVALSPNPAFPTEFSGTSITNYAINVGAIFGGFIVAAIILSIVMIVMCACYCCKKPKEGSQAWFKWVHIGTAIGIVVIALVGCAVGWSYNTQCSNGVNHMSGSVSLLLNGSGTLITNVDGAITNIANKLNIKVANATQQFNFTPVLLPMDGVVTSVGLVKNNTQSFAVITNQMINNVSIIKTDFAFMSNSSANLTKVPAGSEIPNIDTSFSSSVTSANNSASDLYNNVVGVRTQLNNTLSSISSDKLSQVRSQTADYSKQVTSLTSNFDSIRSQLTSVSKDFDGTYSPQIKNYSYIRTSVVSAILVLPISITIVALVGVFFRNTIVLKVCMTLSFIFFFWYMLIAGVNYTLYTVTNGFCAAESDIIAKILGNLNKNTTVGNNTFALSTKVTELLQCKGNTSLLTIFEADSVIDDLISTVKGQTDKIISDIDGLNFTAQFSDASQNCDNFKQKLSSLDFSQSKNISEVQTKLNANVATLLTLEDQSQAAFNDTLANINSITQNAILDNGTYVSVTYSAVNIMSLNCSDDTWEKVTPSSAHIHLCGNQTVAQVVYPKLVDLNNTVNYGVDAQGRVNAIPEDIVVMNATQYQIIDNIGGVQNYLGQVEDGITGFLTMIKGLINGLADFLIDAVGDLGQATGCSFVGSAYAGFNTGFCKELSPSLQVIAAMMILGAASLFATAVHSSIAIHRINGSDEDSNAYSYDDEEKGKKNVSLHVRSSQD